MKKYLTLLALSGVCFALSSPTIALSKETPDLPYVEGLGYEVTPPDFSGTQLYKYDSGWKHFLGGTWRHGVGSRYVWSHFDHQYKEHKTSVKGHGGQMSYSGWTPAKRRASASWEKAPYDNKAYADVK